MQKDSLAEKEEKSNAPSNCILMLLKRAQVEAMHEERDQEALVTENLHERLHGWAEKKLDKMVKLVVARCSK